MQRLLRHPCFISNDLELEHEEDYVTVRALAGTGSAANVANHQKHFPGAVLRKSRGQLNGVRYVTAGGGELANEGEFDIVFRQQADDGSETMRRTTFQNADVGMPSLSTHEIAANQKSQNNCDLLKNQDLN